MPLPPLRGDGARLGQLLDNPVSNAVKFTPTGGRVVVAVARRGDDALVAVSDTGIGVPAAEQRRLFDRFFRASSAHERAIDGTGLGLTIAPGRLSGRPGGHRPLGSPPVPPRSLWLREALAAEDGAASPELRGPARADVCVVGGGYTGL
ncbi:MAG TPA: ATP-binding protein, partial [Gaiellaceae bacterium]|nr:ATP-binding protein [Gaiellaceae bacterium]